MKKILIAAFIAMAIGSTVHAQTATDQFASGDCGLFTEDTSGNPLLECNKIVVKNTTADVAYWLNTTTASVGFVNISGYGTATVTHIKNPVMPPNSKTPFAASGLVQEIQFKGKTTDGTNTPFSGAIHITYHTYIVTRLGRPIYTGWAIDTGAVTFQIDTPGATPNGFSSCDGGWIEPVITWVLSPAGDWNPNPGLTCHYNGQLYYEDTSWLLWSVYVSEQTLTL